MFAIISAGPWTISIASVSMMKHLFKINAGAANWDHPARAVI